MGATPPSLVARLSRELAERGHLAPPPGVDLDRCPPCCRESGEDACAQHRQVARAVGRRGRGPRLRSGGAR